MASHRFRPRYRGLAWSAVGVGGALGTLAAALGFLAVPLVGGVLGIAAGVAYLASPTWRLEVVTDDNGLVVRSPKRERFRLAWSEVVKVIASPTTHSCFVDGGAAENSLLVPGVGAPAPYDLEDRVQLYDTILAHVAADKVETVETLEQAAAAMRAAATTKPAPTEPA
ncbi:MAG TPA: hypothetical protein VFQ53_40475 [Kofleriaceae bacterium]|nr:hypothetical protein [Kofleriaceae bacterium]